MRGIPYTLYTRQGEVILFASKTAFAQISIYLLLGNTLEHQFHPTPFPEGESWMTLDINECSLSQEILVQVFDI